MALDGGISELACDDGICFWAGSYAGNSTCDSDACPKDEKGDGQDLRKGKKLPGLCVGK